MTNLKALPRPSLTMLWTARLYAIWALGFNLVQLNFYAREPDRVVVTYFVTPDAHTGRPQTGNSSIMEYHGPTASLLRQVLLIACLTFGLLMLHRPLGRMIVGTAAAGALLSTLCRIFPLLFLSATANSLPVGFLHSKFPLILAACFWDIVWQLVNIWLALQPPDQARISPSPIDRPGNPPSRNLIPFMFSC